jgi:hypothetical protein
MLGLSFIVIPVFVLVMCVIALIWGNNKFGMITVAIVVPVIFIWGFIVCWPMLVSPPQPNLSCGNQPQIAGYCK